MEVLQRYVLVSDMLWRFAAVPGLRSLQLWTFITIQPGTTGALATSDKTSLASLVPGLTSHKVL